MKKNLEIICGIYKFTSPSGKVYIGLSVNIWARHYQHKYSVNGSRDYKLINSFRKYGFENHIFEIIHVCDEEELNKWEKHYGDLFRVNSKDGGLNLRECGGSNGRHSEESRKKMSVVQSNIIHKPHTEESKRARRIWSIENDSVRFMKEWIKLNGSPMKGKTQTPESREKNRVSNLGRIPWNKGRTGIYDSETIELMRVGGAISGYANKGRTHSDQSRKNMSEAHKGQVAWNRGLAGLPWIEKKQIIFNRQVQLFNQMQHAC